MAKKKQLLNDLSSLLDPTRNHKAYRQVVDAIGRGNPGVEAAFMKFEGVGECGGFDIRAFGDVLMR